MTDENLHKTDITTNTIAELYIRQGYLDKALDIYRAILELDPGNASAEAKIREIEGQMGGAGTESQPLEISAETLPTAEKATIELQIRRLEGWLNRIRAIRREY